MFLTSINAFEVLTFKKAMFCQKISNIFADFFTSVIVAIMMPHMLEYLTDWNTAKTYVVNCVFSEVLYSCFHGFLNTAEL